MADYYPFDPVHSAAQASYHPQHAPPDYQPSAISPPHNNSLHAPHQPLTPLDAPTHAAYPIAMAPADYSPPPVAPAAPVESVPAPPEKPKTGRGRRKQQVHHQPPAFDHAASSASSANAPRNVNIKTKFPVARIKRIMQADEDVGKVAQVTPVVVNKALELFMIALCDKASAQARLRSSKRITASHLKQAIIHEEQFDFLADIIEKVPDIPLPSEASRHSNDGDSGDDNNGVGAPPPPPPVKKTRKPRQRKVKDDDAI